MGNTDVVQQAVAAFNDHDPAAVAARYTEDAVVYDPAYPEPLAGRDAIAQDARDFFRAFPDLHNEVERVVSQGDVTAVEVDLRGTHRGPLPLPDGELPATGKQFTAPVAIFLRADQQDRIVEEHRYYDLNGMRRQLGLS